MVGLQQCCSKSCIVGISAQVQTVYLKDRCHIHYCCVLDCICQRSSRRTFPLADFQFPDSQTCLKAFCVLTQGFRRHHDLLHHCLSLSRPTSDTSGYSMSKTVHPGISRLPGRWISFCFTSIHERFRGRGSCGFKRKSWQSASFPSNEGGLPRPLRSLSKSASRGSVIFGDLCTLCRTAVSMNRLRYHARTQDDSMTALLAIN